MNILLLEDDKIQLHALTTLLKNKYHDSSVTSTDTYDNAVKALSYMDFDVFILDIKLGSVKHSGADFAEYIRNLPKYSKTPIIFLTSLTDEIKYCVNKLHCYSYITKPFAENDLYDTIDSLLKAPKEPYAPDTIKLMVDNCINMIVRIDDIIYVCSDRHTLEYICTTGSIKSGSHTMNELCRILPEKFIRCHKSYIVNEKFIEYYDKTNRILTVKHSPIPVGRAYKSNIDSIFESRRHA